MSKKIMAIYCLLFVLIVTLVFSHFVDIPNMKEGFDLLSQLNKSVPGALDDKSEEDTLLKPEPAPGDSVSTGPAPAPTSDEIIPINSKIQDNISTKTESFQTRNNKLVSLPKRNKPKSEGVFNHIFSDNKSDFKLKGF